MQAVGFTSVCSTWCRGRGQSGAVISWYAAVRNEARARRMMLRGDDFWQFASNTGRLVEYQVPVPVSIPVQISSHSTELPLLSYCTLSCLIVQYYHRLLVVFLLHFELQHIEQNKSKPKYKTCTW